MTEKDPPTSAINEETQNIMWSEVSGTNHKTLSALIICTSGVFWPLKIKVKKTNVDRLTFNHDQIEGKKTLQP